MIDIIERQDLKSQCFNELILILSVYHIYFDTENAEK